VSDFTRANFSQLQQSQADFSLSLRALEDTLHDLESDLQTHLAQWDGDAQSAYYVAKQQWESAAQHMALVLQQLGVVIGDAHQNYSAAERANSGIWGD
jgi:6 kDa early secretory antigenic target